MPCAVSCARRIVLATISSSPCPSQPPPELARLLPAALRQRVPVVRPRRGRRGRPRWRATRRGGRSAARIALMRAHPAGTARAGASRPRSPGGRRSRACCPGARRRRGRRPRRAPRRASPCSSIHGARMKTARTGSPSMPGDLEVGLERADLAPERVAPAACSRRAPRCSRSSMIIPAQVPSTGVPRADQLAQRLGQPLALDPERHRRRLAARDHEPVEPVEVGGHAHLAHLGAEPAQHRARAPRSRPGARARRRAARSPAAVGEELLLLELARLERRHRLAEALGRAGDALGVAEVRRRLDDRGGARRRDPRT